MAAERRFRVMGTEAHIVVAGSEAKIDLAARTLTDLEARWSRFDPASEVSRVNAGAGRPVPVSEHTADLVAMAMLWWQETSGRFDPTVLPALVAAGYDRSFERLGESEPARRAAVAPRATPGCGGIVVDLAALTVAIPAGTAIDLGGIGKGRAADIVARRLAAAGVHEGLVNLGGDLRAWGVGGTGWPIGIVDPHTPDDDLAVVGLANAAMATSSTARRRWVGPDGPAHHIIDPSTGRPAGSDIVSVTVIAATTVEAEVLAKAALLAGRSEGVGLLESHGVDGLLVDRDGGRVEAGDFRRWCW